MSQGFKPFRAFEDVVPRPAPTRRGFGATAWAGLATVLLGGCQGGGPWHETDVSGVSPALAFTMTRASDGEQVTAADYRGKIVMLYFGYTFCPDVCPTTLANVADVLKQIGPDADRVRFLFVTVDPNRDTASVLAAYVKNFAPEMVGLRGSPDQLAALARRYRVAYSVTPQTKTHPYELTHSSVIYVFDGSGAARLLISSLADAAPDLSGTASDLKRLAHESGPRGLLAGLWSKV
jgi:protein SCO1